MWIEITNIIVAGKQLAKLDAHKVEAHRMAYEQGHDVWPIDVVQTSEGRYNICGNGRHRYFGAIAAGFTHIEANVLNE